MVEVWNFAEPTSQIVGITTISLHQLYTAFHDETIASKHLSAEIPVIAVHDWLSVRDVLAGTYLLDTIQDFLCELGMKPRIWIPNPIGNHHFFTLPCHRQTYRND